MSTPPTDDVPPTTAEPLVGPASETEWREERLRFRPLHMVRTWLISAIGLLIAAWIVPGADINGFWAALLVAAVIAALYAILSPVIAAIRLPLSLVFGFLAILVLDALMLLAADAITDERMSVDGFWWALLVAFLASAVTLVIEVVAVLGFVGTGWLGGELVDRLGVGVDPGANLNAPSSISGRPARGV